MKKLLQEGDYTKGKKECKSAGSVIDSVYWPLVTVVYLAWSFLTNGWHYTWVIWPIAGVLYAALVNVVGTFRKKQSE